MALDRKDRAKSAKQQRLSHENFQSYSSNASKSFILGTYLDSMNAAEKKTNSKKRSQNKSGKVANRSIREMGAYSWTPLATRTAVGYGDNLYMETLSPEKGLSRPESAPIIRMRRSRSMNSVDTMSSGSLSASLVTSHASSRKNSNRGYMEEPLTLCVRAFPNGTIERSVRVTAKTLHQLLEEATGKLNLPSAGRRIFLPDGTLVRFAHQLYKDCSVYISMGEPFKDPCEVLRDNERMRLSSSWTITGIMLPEDRTNSKKTKLSKRMKSLLENPKHRVLVFRNGESREGAEVVANRFDEFLADCTGKLSLNASARILYIWNGSEAQNFLELSKASTDHLIQTSQHAAVLGPVWVSKGEPFDPTGAYDYFLAVAINIKQNIKRETKSLENKILDGGVGNYSKEKMNHDEIDKEIAKGKANVRSMKATLKELKSRLKAIKVRSESEIPPEIISNSRRFDNTKGYRLKLRLNGSENPNSIVLPFSSKDLGKGKKTKEEALRSFFNLLNSNHSLRECFIGHGRRAEFKRAFLLNGAEITDINEVDGDAEVWLSLGEDFIPIEYEVVGIATDTVKCISYWNEKRICQRQPWIGAEGKLAKQSLWDMITSVPLEIMTNELIPESTIEDQKLVLVSTINKERLRTDGLFMQNKKDANLILYPELQLARIGRGQDVTLWGEDSKQWILSQDGTITNKFFRNMALAIGDQEISLQQNDQTVKGYAVGLALRTIALGSSNDNKSHEQGSRPQMDPRQLWKLTPDGHIASVMLGNLYLTSICGLRVEVPQDVQEKEGDLDLSKSSLTSSSDSESSQKSGGDDSKTKKMKKRKKKDKTAKEKKKWWDFGSSSSSSDSGDEDDAPKEIKKSSEDIKVRMKWTSSEDDKNEMYSKRERTSVVEEELDAEEKSKEEVVKMADDLLKEVPEVYGGEKMLFGVFDKFGDKDPARIRQRWAIKTEDAGSLLSSATLSNKWMRQELAWPVNEANVWVEDSITGFIIPCAPKLKRKIPKKEKPNSSFYGQPARLKVLRNGEHESSRAVIVIGPDLSNMTRRVQASLPLKWKKRKGGFQDVHGASVADVEFEKFLDKCTESLGLPFAARRLFDENGKELTSVNKLERDQLVYVSCGENWVDPHVTYSEQQRRLLLANLASDVCKIRNYLLLRDQSDLIIQVDGALQANSRLTLTKKPDNEEAHTNEGADSSPHDDQAMQEDAIRQLQKSYLNSHQIAHIKSDERLQNIREQFQHDLGATSNMATNNNTEDYSPFSNPSMGRKFSPSEEPVSRPPPSAYHQWVYHDGFIQLKANKKLVIGVQESDESTPGQDVIICTKKVEDSLQRWIISDLGFIHLKCNPQLVLTVATPVLQTDPFSDALLSRGYAESRIILGKRLDYCNGNSNQMFDVEVDTGYINAFSTDLTNTEVTAAAKASVCTYSIFGSKKIHQPGYSISEATKPKSAPVRVCESCGRAIRGKLKLQKIKEIAEFSCAMGTPEKFGLAANGSFKCLSNQVDLSQREADSTLLVWEGQLKRLQKESSVKVIAYELNLAQTTPSVRILAHKNGDIGYNDGVIVIANSINQFLDLCTFKLGLPQAARKLFTMNGELIIDMSQLLQPFYPELCLPLSKSSPNDIKQKSSSREEDTQDASDCFLSLTSTLSSDSYCEGNDAVSINPNGDKTANGESIKPTKKVAFANIDAEKERDENQIVEKMDVRVPIDVWVSCGEPFIPFEDSERMAIRTAQDREERSRVADYLEKEKHRLRQLQGRRFAGRTSAQGDLTLVKPVLMKVWEQPSKQEEIIEKSIEDLQLHLSELKSQQDQERLIDVSNARPKSARLFDKMQERKLYNLPRGLNILVYPNGEHSSRALSVIASSMTELLDKATSRLGLNSAARRAFTKHGDEIYDFDEIEKGQLICVTCGEKFVPNRERRQKIEMRASWSRSQRQKSHTTPSDREPSAALALPGPPSQTISRNSPVIRQPKHEETIHIFENSKKTPSTSPLSAPPPSSSSPRPKSAVSNSKQAAAGHGPFTEQNSPSPRTAGPTFAGPKPATSGTTKLWKNSNTSLSEASTDLAPNRPSLANMTYVKGMSARPGTGQAKILTSKNLKATVVES